MNGSGVVSTVGRGVGVRRGPAVSRPLGTGVCVHSHDDARADGAGDKAPIGPGTARMLATSHAVKRPPATARTSTTTAATTQPAALPDERRGLFDGVLAGPRGGAAEPE